MVYQMGEIGRCLYILGSGNVEVLDKALKAGALHSSTFRLNLAVSDTNKYTLNTP